MTKPWPLFDEKVCGCLEQVCAGALTADAWELAALSLLELAAWASARSNAAYVASVLIDPRRSFELNGASLPSAMMCSLPAVSQLRRPRTAKAVTVA